MKRLVVVIVCVACGRDSAAPPINDDHWKDPAATLPQLVRRPKRDRSTAKVEPRAPVIAIRNATIMTATGQTITDGTIVLSGGAIAALGPAASTAIPDKARIVDGKGKFVTPGIIDTHSHIGVY